MNDDAFVPVNIIKEMYMAISKRLWLVGRVGQEPCEFLGVAIIMRQREQGKEGYVAT